jgi:hypothetical protein
MKFYYTIILLYEITLDIYFLRFGFKGIFGKSLDQGYLLLTFILISIFLLWPLIKAIENMYRLFAWDLFLSMSMWKNIWSPMCGFGN